MKKKIKHLFPIACFVSGIILIISVGYQIYCEPYHEADKRNHFEDMLIDGYMDEKAEIPDEAPSEEAHLVEYQYIDVNDYSFRVHIDCILVIDKINMKKAVIRGNTLADNDFNLSKYYFVTADLSTTLKGNYIIYGHSSQTYGHSFNRLDEMNVDDTFYVIQGNTRYSYKVEAVDRVLRSKSDAYFPHDVGKRVTLVACEKNLAAGYSEKRIIIVRAVQTREEKI